MLEHKYIIVKVNGKLRHFKSFSEDHVIIARRHNLKDTDIIEKGILDVEMVEVWECYDKEHLHKIKTRTPERWLGFDIEDYGEKLKRRG